MYELIKAGENSYYIDCPAKIGIYVTETGAILIDSGSDRDAGRKARQTLEKNGWSLKYIVNTHSNADHSGGNAYLQKNSGCKIFANGIEADMINHPLLEPSFLFGGYPCSALKNKFLMAQPSDALPFTDAAFPNDLKVIPLPGHFFDMTGFRTPDNVVYLADCIASEATLDKYGIPFMYDIASYYDTLDKVEAMEASLFVPAHAPASADIAPLVRYNREKLSEAVERLICIIASPLCFEAALAKVFDSYGMTLTMQQYALVGSTVRSMLSYLCDTHRAEYFIENNILFWKSI